MPSHGGLSTPPRLAHVAMMLLNDKRNGGMAGVSNDVLVTSVWPASGMPPSFGPEMLCFQERNYRGTDPDLFRYSKHRDIEEKKQAITQGLFEKPLYAG